MGKFRRSRARQTDVKNKIADKKRRARREKGKVPSQAKSKDMGVPFKGKFPLPNEQRKLRAEEVRNIQKKGRSKLQFQNRNLSDLQGEAESRDDEFSARSAKSLLAEDRHNVNQTFKNYYKEYKKVVEAADVILQVLDARDPLGSRCPEVEQAVLNSGTNKRLVLVLNKIDLIPQENLEKWLKYLSQELPTVAFKASTQSQKDNLSVSKVPAVHMNQNLQSSRRCIGANYLMKLLGNYCRNQNILTSIRVGVVGFPNVGKSSIINSLLRCRTCVVGGTPGVTKNMQEVILDKHIRLLDSPGIVFAKEGSESSLALRNAIKIEKLDDVITPAQSIIQRASRQQLMDHYRVTEFSSSDEFLFLMAKRIGRYKKGGVPDPEAAARKLLNDWNKGIIRFHTQPPEVFQPSTHISAEVVAELGKAFDVSLLGEQMELEKLSEDSVSDDIDAEPDQGTDDMVVVANKPEDVIEKSADVIVNIVQKKENAVLDTMEYTIPPRLQQNRNRKKMYKKMKKTVKRNDRVAQSLSDTMDAALSLLK